MRFSIATLFAALFVLVHAEPTAAVQLYLTPDQGYPFETPSDPREVDAIGAPGPSGLVALVGPAESAVRFNLWVDPIGDTLSFLGLRMQSLGGAVFTDWDSSGTLAGTLPDDSSGIVSSFITMSNIDFTGFCGDFSGLAAPPAGLPQGSCVGSGPGVTIFDGPPDQTAPMLLGTLTMDLTAGGQPGVTLVEVTVGALSSYQVIGQEEMFFAPQVMLQAPEPATFVLLAVALAALRFRRRA